MALQLTVQKNGREAIAASNRWVPQMIIALIHTEIIMVGYIRLTQLIP